MLNYIASHLRKSESSQVIFLSNFEHHSLFSFQTTLQTLYKFPKLRISAICLCSTYKAHDFTILPYQETCVNNDFSHHVVF
jgi:hypothetical protein